MKKEIQPNSRLVIFEDSQTKKQYLILSTISAKEVGIYDLDNKEYPLVKIDVTADSHPFYTGEQTFIQATGQVEKFNKRFRKVK